MECWGKEMTRMPLQENIRTRSCFKLVRQSFSASLVSCIAVAYGRTALMRDGTATTGPDTLRGHGRGESVKDHVCLVELR